MPSILVTRRLPAAVLDRLRSTGEVDLHEGDAMTASELRTRLASADAIVSMLTDQLDAAAIDAAPKLRIIANVAVGYNNVDVRHAASRGLVVTNTPDVLTDAVADFTWGLILANMRRIAEVDRLVRRGGWRGWAFDFMLGAELRGRVAELALLYAYRQRVGATRGDRGLGDHRRVRAGRCARARGLAAAGHQVLDLSQVAMCGVARRERSDALRQRGR